MCLILCVGRFLISWAFIKYLVPGCILRPSVNVVPALVLCLCFFIAMQIGIFGTFIAGARLTKPALLTAVTYRADVDYCYNEKVQKYKIEPFEPAPMFWGANCLN